MKHSLSVVINTKNAASTLNKCLESIQKISSDLVIVDMHSSDQTVEIAKQYNARVFFHEDIGYVEPARNFALEKAKGDWILVLDADEYLEESTIEYITHCLEQTEYSVFSFPRKNLIFNKWIQHTGWWPDRQIRLFKKGTVEWQVGIHSQPTINGKLTVVPAEERYAISHLNYATIESYIERLQRYTSLTGNETDSVKRSHQNNIGVESIKAVKNEFFSRLFAQNGLKDQGHGVVLALLQSFYQLSTELKIWQKQDFSEKDYDEKAVIEELHVFNKELHYWIADWYVQNTSGWKKWYWKIRRKFSF